MAKTNEFSDCLQLADILIKRRDSTASLEFSKGEITNLGLKKLLQIAFYTSLMPEEGRYPSFRLFVDTKNLRKTRELLVTFKPAIVLTKESLRRLAPAIHATQHALYVIEENDKLKCTGIMLLTSEVAGLEIFSSELALNTLPLGLMIRVDGPGQMRATEFYPTYELRESKIKQVKDYKAIQIINNWFKEIGNTLWFQSLQAKEEIIKFGFNAKKRIPQIIASIWSYIIIIVIERKHGGTFLIMPEGALKNCTLQENKNIELKYFTSGINLGKSSLAFWIACLNESNLKGIDNKEFFKRAREWEVTKNKLFCVGHTIADLSNVDGCVILNRNLELLSFGCEIKVEESELKDVTYYDENTGKDFDIKNYGTRHRSAARICAIYPGMIAFVISQDGGFKIFYGQDRSRVNVWHSESIWMRSRDKW